MQEQDVQFKEEVRECIGLLLQKRDPFYQFLTSNPQL